MDPGVTPVVCEQIAVIPRSAEYEAALREMADPDQISPEYGGTGPALADRLSIADALYAAGSRAEVASDPGELPSDHEDEQRAQERLISDANAPAAGGLEGVDEKWEENGSAPRDSGTHGAEDGAGMPPRGVHILTPVKEDDVESGLGGREQKRGGQGGWFPGTWGAFGGWWGGRQPGDVKKKERERRVTLNTDGSLMSLDEDEVRIVHRREDRLFDVLDGGLPVCLF